MTDDENTTQYRMYCSLGDLELTVKGPDPDWVESEFESGEICDRASTTEDLQSTESQWQARLAEATEMKDAIRRADVSTQ